MTDPESKTVLVTGAAGFIGYHRRQRLLADGDDVVGLDNLNDYYDVEPEARRGSPGSRATTASPSAARPRRPRGWRRSSPTERLRRR